ncbi:ABC transporter ATP-binding protein [Cytobacillus sp. Sa5YUA1]|uniref:ABC transporter ATP-binding protein n=2 Tax=Cytobacillus stercorigallinarum TaxID=2762240 RepID=A0ABR8QP56_9BACI|nr:ABC transporter ATP-binding protein [Cytobacillus stercorigallinarum]
MSNTLMKTIDDDEFSISVKNLTKSFKNQKVIENLNLNIHAKEIHGIIGRNGAEKTTLIESIVGFNEIDQGEIRLLNFDSSINREELMKHIGIQPQVANLLPRQTVNETIYLFSSFYKETMEPKEIMELLELTEISAKRVKDLSVGQKQRLLVALALIGNPSLIILDEPTTGIDPQIRQLIWNVLRGIRNEGCTIVLTTHYMEEAEKLCDRISILHDKKIIVSGTPKEIINTHRKKTSDSLEDVFLYLTGSNLRKEVD